MVIARFPSLFGFFLPQYIERWHLPGQLSEGKGWHLTGEHEWKWPVSLSGRGPPELVGLLHFPPPHTSISSNVFFASKSKRLKMMETQNSRSLNHHLEQSFPKLHKPIKLCMRKKYVFAGLNHQHFRISSFSSIVYSILFTWLPKDAEFYILSFQLPEKYSSSKSQEMNWLDQLKLSANLLANQLAWEQSHRWTWQPLLVPQE
jgi:hypothetical protein